MNKELAIILFMLDGASKVINDPSKSLKETTGIYKDSSNTWKYIAVTGVTSSAVAISAGITAGSAAVVSGATLSGLGMAALTAAGAAGGGVAAAGGGIAYYRAKKKAKREQEEKDRMYREIIKKQQAAINKQKEINRNLEETLRSAQSKNRANNKDIEILKKQIKNLQEVIDILTEQMEEFGNAA